MEVGLSVDDNLDMIDPGSSPTSFAGKFILFIDTENANIVYDIFINNGIFLNNLCLKLLRETCF